MSVRIAHRLLSMGAKTLDGSVLEGGGQLLRNAVAYSALLSEPITIHNIRQNRQPPGLKNQHAAGTYLYTFYITRVYRCVCTTGILLAAEISSAQVTGVVHGSSSISFAPGPIRLARRYTADPGTAGSTTLLFQTSLPCVLFSREPPCDSQPPQPSELVLKGGTNATKAPQIDYTQHIFLPFLSQHFSLSNIVLSIVRRGYFPRGGGEVRVAVPSIPGPLPAITLTERGAVTRVRGRAYVAGRLPTRLSGQMRSAAIARLVACGIPEEIIHIDAVREQDWAGETMGNGTGILLWAETEGGCRLAGSAIGDRKQNMDSVGDSAAEELMQNLEHGGCVDEYLQVGADPPNDVARTLKLCVIRTR